MASQWQALYRSLRSDIDAGRLAAGARLPSENELSQRHGVSRNTVRRAFLALSQDGSIRSVNGSGSFVMPTGVTYEIDALSRLRTALAEHGVESASRFVDSAVAPADAALAARLGVEPGHAVLSHTAVILGDGVPFLLTTRHFPADLMADFHARLLRTGSFTALLAEAGLGALHRISTTVGARLPDAREAALLECPRNAPLLDVTATGALAGGRVVEWQHAVMNSRLIKLSFANR